jgi:hypothetical protein
MKHGGGISTRRRLELRLHLCVTEIWHAQKRAAARTKHYQCDPSRVHAFTHGG